MTTKQDKLKEHEHKPAAAGTTTTSPGPGGPAPAAQLPATTGGNQLMVIDYGTEAGAGMEDIGKEEYKIPLFAILQPNSPQVAAVTAGGMGAPAGALYNTATAEVHSCIDSDSKPRTYGMIPVMRNHDFVEYKPRKAGAAGGFVNLHKPDAELAVILRAAWGRFGKIKILHETEKRYIDDGSQTGIEIPSLVEAFSKKNISRVEIGGAERSIEDVRAIYREIVTPMMIGNDLVETYYIYKLFFANEDEVQMTVLPFKSTQIPVYQAFMTRYLSIKYPDGKGNRIGPPLWAHQLRLGTRFTQNAKGKFFNYTLGLAEEPPIKCRMLLNDPLYVQARAFYDLLKEGKVRVQHKEAAAAGANDDAGGGNGAGADKDIPF